MNVDRDAVGGGEWKPKPMDQDDEPVGEAGKVVERRGNRSHGQDGGSSVARVGRSVRPCVKGQRRDGDGERGHWCGEPHR